MNYIEQKLREKTESFPESRKYIQQWEIAKDFIPQVLNTISHYFPHYSLHDATHSESILNNIVMIMGEDVIDQLSVVDLWLLLCAAYYHDLGMFVSKDDKLEFLKEGSNFVNYIREKIEDLQSPMHQYAQLYEVKEGKVFYRNNELTAQNVDAQRFLMADFIRSQHAKRSATYIQSADSLHLPGNPIPDRIIKILASICKGHTQSQETLMELPVTENSGCGTESCHPLFIACMLRIGDLLDVDTNRVSSVLLSTLPSIPADSKSYNQTNRDITHILIGRSVVEITAECEEYEVAKLLKSWFKMIDDELTFQSKNWYKIAPSVKFGSLPSAGKLIVKLKGYDEISGKNSLKFEIDNSKAIEMLQGAGLYNSASQCIRELLQNAVDATYLRIFMENPNINERAQFKLKCAEHPINVIFDKLRVDEKYSYWHLVIRDNGVGMGEKDMKFLAKTGSSNQNKEKNRYIDEMPAWMRPSGTFGIGFQSIFLITDKVYLRTRKWGTEQTVELEMYNPAGNEDGAILKKTNRDNNITFGTSIECDITFRKHPDWSVNSSEKAALEAIGNYDFARDESLDVEAAKIVDEIERFSELSYVPVKLSKNGADISFSQNSNDSYDYYDERTGMEVSLGSMYGVSAFYYRNQYVSKYKTNLPMLLFSINKLSGSAKDILELSRNDVRRESIAKVREDSRKAMIRFLIANYDSFDKQIKSSNIKLKPIAAAILEMNRSFIEEFQDEITCNFPEDWLNLEICGVNKDKQEDKRTIRSLFQFGRVEFVSDSAYELQFYSAKAKNIPTFVISQNSHKVDHEVFDFLCSVLHKVYTHISYKSTCIVLSKKETGELIENTDEAKRRWFKNYMSRGAYARGLYPCLSKYEKLKLKDITDYDILSKFGVEHDVMLSPYIRSSQNERYDVFFQHKSLEYLVDESVLSFVYAHRYDENTTIQEIKDSFEQFRMEYQPIIDSINKPAEGKKK